MDQKQMQALMQQAQQIQEKLQQTVIEASAGGGSVTVKMNGQKKVLAVTIDPEIMKSGDLEMLQDLVVAAVNEGSRKVDETLQSNLGRNVGRHARWWGTALLMSQFAEPMARLIAELKKLPGIGAKSAQRLAFHILRSSADDAEALADSVRDIKEKLRFCSLCNNITDVDPCVYCSSPTRNLRMVCVVEEPTNVNAIEKTRHYNGVYHVLHGAISPLHGVGPEHLRINNLLKRIDHGDVDEIIIATNPTVEGEATAFYLSQQVKKHGGIKVTRIATGIPAGSDIEYADEVTMMKSIEGRREL